MADYDEMDAEEGVAPEVQAGGDGRRLKSTVQSAGHTSKVRAQLGGRQRRSSSRAGGLSARRPRRAAAR